MSAIEVRTDRVREVLQRAWEDLRDGGNTSDRRQLFAERQAQVEGMIAIAGAVGLLDADAVELWTARIQRCPGHGSPRSWCAYCGDVPPWEFCPDEAGPDCLACRGVKCAQHPDRPSGQICDSCGPEERHG